MQVLHILMLNLTEHPFDAALFEFLEVDERLVDIGDDLVDYEVRSVLIGLPYYTHRSLLGKQD